MTRAVIDWDSILARDRLGAAADVVLDRCDRLAQYSQEPDRLVRLSYSPSMAEVLDQVDSWMRQASLTVRFDGVRNIVGRKPSDDSVARTLIIGSHLDTVVDAGRYDGILGVMIGLAVAEALTEVLLPFHLDVVGFHDEEGVRFSSAYLGSRGMIGHLDTELDSLRDEKGSTFGDMLDDWCLDRSAVKRAFYEPDAVLGYVEAHIEQGPVLEGLGAPVGVVDAIAGQDRLRVRLVGEAGHAGTVPMHRRRDAGVAAAELILAVHRHAREIPDLMATVGKLKLEPNVRNVIPGAAVVDLDIRHADDRVRVDAVAEILATARGVADTSSLQLIVEQHDSEAAVPMDGELSEALARAVSRSGLVPHRLASGAGHDAVMMSLVTRTAMLFLRCGDGVSHHPDESVLRDDVVTALEVMLRFVGSLEAA